MGAKIITAEDLAERKVQNGLTRSASVYLGTMAEAANKGVGPKAKIKFNGADGAAYETEDLPFKVTSKAWANSEGRFQLLRDLKALQDVAKNSAPSVSPDTLATYFAKLFIDVTRQADDLADYSDMIYNVMSRPDAQEVTYLRDLLPYVGKERVISGANDSVPLIEANLAQQESITQYIKAFGFKSNIHNMLFLPIDELSRVTQAAAAINVDSRNADVIGHLVGLTYPAKQAQAADATAGESYDEKMYNTFRKAIKKLAALKHPLSSRLLADMGAFNGGVRVLCHPADVWAVQRVARGELSSSGGVRMIASALPISDIIGYGGGIMNGMVWGKETLSLSGVTQGTAYIFLPNTMAGFVLDKRTQTMEMGTGSVLQLSTEERAWYRVNGLHHKWFTGGAETNTDSGLGCIVKVTLPAES